MPNFGPILGLYIGEPVRQRRHQLPIRDLSDDRETLRALVEIYGEVSRLRLTADRLDDLVDLAEEHYSHCDPPTSQYARRRDWRSTQRRFEMAVELAFLTDRRIERGRERAANHHLTEMPLSELQSPSDAAGEVREALEMDELIWRLAQQYGEGPEILGGVATWPGVHHDSLLSRLHSPPYTVEFTGDRDDERYKVTPYHVPAFQIVPRTEDAIAVRSSRFKSGRKSYGYADLSEYDLRVLNHQRAWFATCIRRMIVPYLRHRAWILLTPKLRPLVVALQKGNPPWSDLRKAFNISDSELRSRFDQLDRRGWERLSPYDEKGIAYTPTRDQTGSLFGDATSRFVRSTSATDLIKAVEPAYFNCSDERELQSFIDAAWSDVVSQNADRVMIVAHDARIKFLIRRIVESPMIVDDATLGQLIAKLKPLDNRRQAGILFEAIRTEATIESLFSLSDQYSRELKSASHGKAPITLRDLERDPAINMRAPVGVIGEGAKRRPLHPESREAP